MNRILTNRLIVIILFFLVLTLTAKAQKTLYGINFEKSYPGIKEFGTDNLEKVIILKDRSLFYSVKVTFSYFVFSAIGSGERTVYDTWNHPEKFYLRGLNDVKKVFGESLSIYTDTAYTTKTKEFYIWKIKRTNGYFLIYYSIGYANRGLTLNVYKFDLEKDVDREIENELNAQQRYRNREFFIKQSDVNTHD